VRWFIVFLLVANVILFFWVQQESRPLPGSTGLPPPDVGRLRLLSEGIVEQHAVAVDAVPSSPADPAAAAGSGIASEAVANAMAGSQASPAQSAGPAEQTRLTGLAESAGQAEPAERRTAGLDAAPALPPADPVVPAPVAEAPTNSEPPSDPVAVVAPATADAVQPVCARVGPLAAAEANQLIANLPAQLNLLSDVSEEYTAADAYFVMIAPLPSRSAGYQKLQELADAGIEDTWLFPSGEYRNAISLGLFRREGGARRHAASLQSKGFAAEVRPRNARKEGRWLLLQDADGGDIGPRLPLSQQVTVEQRPCP
jgi:hypothetical protein